VAGDNVQAGIYTLTIKGSDSDGSSTTKLVIAVGTTGQDDFTSLSGYGAQVLAFGLAQDDAVTTGDYDDTILGGAGDDLLIGGSGNDIISGGGGKDVITGGGGADALEGGTNADTFVYLSATDSGVGSADTIEHFVSGQDHIDLSAFGIAIADVTLTPAGDWTTVDIDTNGDLVADMQINVHGTVVSGDLIFA
jgi:serralysin